MSFKFSLNGSSYWFLLGIFFSSIVGVLERVATWKLKNDFSDEINANTETDVHYALLVFSVQLSVISIVTAPYYNSSCRLRYRL